MISNASQDPNQGIRYRNEGAEDESCYPCRKGEDAEAWRSLPSRPDSQVQRHFHKSTEKCLLLVVLVQKNTADLING